MGGIWGVSGLCKEVQGGNMGCVRGFKEGILAV